MKDHNIKAACVLGMVEPDSYRLCVEKASDHLEFQSTLECQKYVLMILESGIIKTQENSHHV